jgi:putative ABC transport system permease protein
MRDLLLDLRYAVRALVTRPTLTLAAVITLGLGIGATTAIYSIVYGVVLRPLPFPHADRLVLLCEQFPSAPPNACITSPPNAEDIAARSRTIEALGLARDWSVQIATPDGPEGLPGGIATPGFFRALGVEPEVGRLLDAGDMTGSEGTVAIIAHDLWQTRFGAARDIVGRVVTLNAKPVTIIGVLPRTFAPPSLDWIQVWRPLHINPRDEKHRDWRGFKAFGRLRAGVTAREARAELATIAGGLRRDHFATTAQWGFVMRSMHDYVVGGVRPTLLLFLGAVVVVLLIACANVANLLLARATARSREMALRAALGAGRERIVRALLTESLVLALVGAILGVLLALWTTEAFKHLAPRGIPRIDQVSVNGGVLVFALALAIATAAVFGLAPALQASRVDLAQGLREGGRTGTKRAGRLGAGLVVGELALAVMLVAGAGLLTRTFAAFTRWSPGFEQEHLLSFNTFAARGTYQDQHAVAALWDRVEAELRSVPGVVAVGSSSAGPLFGGYESGEMHMEGAPADQRASVRWYDVSPSFFATIGVPVVRGRSLDASDVIGTPTVALVNETLANRYFPGGTALGKHVEWNAGGQTSSYEIVGVVRDVPPIHAGDPVEPELYWSNRQQPRPFSYFVVRTGVPPAAVAASVRARLRAIDRGLRPADVATLTERVAVELRNPRFNMTLLVAFAFTALLLAAIGTYGVLAYTVAQRTREIGVRIALGAQRGHVLGHVMRQGLTLAALGIAVGTALALALARTIAGLVAGVSARDPLTLALSGLVVGLVAVGACLVPALRASRVDPVTALAAE